MNTKKRILLKISGSQLKADNSNSIFFEDSLKKIVEQVETLTKNFQVAMVLGGGNIWRGQRNNINKINHINSDFIGMLSTVINGLALKDLLQQKNIKTRLFSALHCPRLTEEVNKDSADAALNNGEVVIFVGGTGLPCITTDTTAVLRAIEINASEVLFGKDGIDGVYDKDPKIHQDALFFSQLSYAEIISRELKVMDQSALFLARDNNMKFLVFNQSKDNAFVDAINRKIQLTEVGYHGE